MVSEIVKKVLEVKEVTFNNVVLKAVKKENGKIYAVIKNFCDDLGLASNKQISKIKNNEVLNRGYTILVLPSNSGEQSYSCIEVDFLPLWLSSISVKKAKEEIRPLLLEFQLKAKDILATAFIKTEPVPEEKEKLTSGPSKNNNGSSMEFLRQMFLALDETNKIATETKELTNRAMSTAEYALTKVLEIENKNKIAREEFKTEVEYSTRLLPDLKIRHKCQKIVDAYISNNFLAVTKEDYKSIWHQVDKEYRINLGLQKKNRQKQTNQKVTRYDIAEDLGKIEELFAVISFLWLIMETKALGINLKLL